MRDRVGSHFSNLHILPTKTIFKRHLQLKESIQAIPPRNRNLGGSLKSGIYVKHLKIVII